MQKRPNITQFTPHVEVLHPQEIVFLSRDKNMDEYFNNPNDVYNVGENAIVEMIAKMDKCGLRIWRGTQREQKT